MAELGIPRRGIDRLPLIRLFQRDGFAEDVAEETATEITTIVTDQTDGHLTNDQMTPYMERIAKWIAESEARQQEFVIKAMGISIAFLSIELAIFGTVIALVG